MKNKYLIISSCTSKKNYPTEKEINIPNNYDEIINNNTINYLEKLGYKMSAKDMYLGKSHLLIKEAIDIYNKKDIDIDYIILSAGYGILNPNDEIVPYDISFIGKNKKEIIKRSELLNIKDKFEKVINNYDVIILALSSEYLIALQLDKIVSNKKYIFIDSNYSYKKLRKYYESLNNIEKYNWIIKKPEKHGGRIPFRSNILLEIAHKINSEKELSEYIDNKIIE